jgi:hypothetical protein
MIGDWFVEVLLGAIMLGSAALAWWALRPTWDKELRRPERTVSPQDWGLR